VYVVYYLYNEKNGGGKTVKRWGVFLLAVLLCAIAFCMVSSAAMPSSVVIQDIGAYMLDGTFAYVMDDFSETNEEWDCDGNGVDVTASEKIKTFPYAPLTEEGCLVVRNNNALSGNENSISKIFDQPADFSAMSVFFVAVNCSRVDNASYNITAELLSRGNNVYTSKAEIECESWNGVFFDISAWSGKKEVLEIKLSVEYTSTDTPSSDFEYYIDCTAVDSSLSAISKMVFSSDVYNAKGGMIVQHTDRIRVKPRGDFFSIETADYCYKDLKNANALKVKFDSGVFSGIKLYVKRSSEADYVETSYVTSAQFDGENIAYLSFGEGGVHSIRLEFLDVKGTEFNIYGINPCSMSVSDNSNGSVDACAYNSNTNEVVIRGKIKKESVTLYYQKDIYVFAYEFSENVRADALNPAYKVAESAVMSTDYIFRIKVVDEIDRKSFLFKKYVVAINDGEKFVIIGEPQCVTNPEELSDAENIKYSGSGKGIYGESISFMQEVGASDTVVFADIGKFFLQTAGSSSKFDCGGSVFYYNSEYAEVLDNMIKNYAKKNIAVTVIITVSDTGSEALNRLLIHPESNIRADYCAFNTTSSTALKYLRAFCDYFANRYCLNMGAVNGFVFGNCISNCSVNYNMGEKTLSVFAEEYIKGLRTVYNAVRSCSAYVDVYTYIDGGWNRELPYDCFTRYDSRALLCALNSAVLKNGNIDWSVSCNLYPSDMENYYSHADQTLGKSAETEMISFANIEVLENYLNLTALLYENTMRKLIVIEQAVFTETDEALVTADYVYNCYKALNISVSAYITNRSCNYNNAMKYVDTSMSLVTSYFVPELLGGAAWESLIDGFTGSKLEKKTVTLGEIKNTVSGIKGSRRLFAFNDSHSDWGAYGFTESLMYNSTIGGKDGVLSVKLGNYPYGESRGITKYFAEPLDLSLTPVLFFEVNIASLPSDVHSAEVVVILRSGTKSYELTGSVKEAVWTGVYCDFSEFSGVNKVESVDILFRSETGDYFEDPQVAVSEIFGQSFEYDSEQLDMMYSPEDMESAKMEKIKNTAIAILAILVIVCFASFVARRVYYIKTK